MLEAKHFYAKLFARFPSGNEMSKVPVFRNLYCILVYFKLWISNVQFHISEIIYNTLYFQSDNLPVTGLRDGSFYSSEQVNELVLRSHYTVPILTLGYNTNTLLTCWDDGGTE